MKTYLWMAFAFLFLATLVPGCKRRGEKPGGGTGTLSLSAEGASPGMVVAVTATEPAFPDEASTRVEIGGEPAPVAKWISTTQVEVLVPNVAAGESKVTVKGKRAGATAVFTVLPASAQELVLQPKDGKLALLATHPTADGPDVTERSAEPQLSYDLLNTDGVLVFTGSIPHPAQARMELFDGPNATQAILRREVPHPGHPMVFSVKVPLASPGAVVKFYEAAAQVNLMDAAARQGRTPIGEIKIEE